MNELAQLVAASVTAFALSALGAGSVAQLLIKTRSGDMQTDEPTALAPIGVARQDPERPLPDGIPGALMAQKHPVRWHARATARSDSTDCPARKSQTWEPRDLSPSAGVRVRGTGTLRPHLHRRRREV